MVEKLNKNIDKKNMDIFTLKVTDSYEVDKLNKGQKN